VPYLFVVNRFVLQDLRVHAQDFLNATHSETSDSKAIKLSVISMDHAQLSKDKDPSSTAPHGSAYLDDIIWRIVSRLLNEILATNKTALTFNVLGAAANQTASAVHEVAASASRSITDVLIANNPKELIYMANRALSHRKNVTPAKSSLSSIINDPALIGQRGVSKVKVRILQGKGLRQGEDPLDSDSPLVVSVRLVYDQAALGHSESIKCHPKRPDDSFVVRWDETITLEPILSMDAKLHVRVFEFHLLKDSLVCEAFLPLMGVAGSSSGGSSNGGGNGSGSGNGGSDVETRVTRVFSSDTEVVREDGLGEIDHIPEPTGAPEGTLGDSFAPRERKEVLFGLGEAEVVGWYTCFGRQSETDRHKAKGQVELGLLLEE
jgi:hypothetical protein